LKFRSQVNVVFDIISVPCKISGLQVPETLQFIPRGAKCEERKSAET